VHFSESSRVAACFYAAKETDWCANWVQACVDLNKALEDCGCQYEYLSYDEVAAGELRKQGFRVFVMPHSRALSDGEAQAVREFCRNGGVVIADIAPGALNEKGAVRETSALDDLFPADGKAGVKAFGKGKTILIGDMLAGYGRAHMDQFGWARLEGRWRPFGELLEKEAGLAPKVRIVAADQRDVPPTEITRFQFGAAQFVALLREYFLYDNETYPVRITFPCRSYVYDVRERRCLGLTDAVTTEISYEAKLYGLLPYKVEALDLRAPAAAQPGRPTRLRMAVRAAGESRPSKHCFRLEVVGPEGEPLPWYARNVIAENGAAEVDVPWALNQAPGDYALVVTDVNSGVTARKSISLK